jgi:hypothetical protein
LSSNAAGATFIIVAVQESTRSGETRGRRFVVSSRPPDLFDRAKHLLDSTNVASRRTVPDCADLLWRDDLEHLSIDPKRKAP